MNTQHKLLELCINNQRYSLERFTIHQTICENKMENRGERLLNELNQNIPDILRSELTILCKAFSDVFSLEGDTLSTKIFYKQNIRMSDEDLRLYKTLQITTHTEN